MITKKQAALLYGYGYKLVDKYENIYWIEGLENCPYDNEELTLELMGHKLARIINKQIGSDYFILCRPLSSLTKTMVREGKEIVPMIELFKLAGFRYWDDKADYYLSQMKIETGHQELTLYDGSNKLLFQYRSGNFKLLRLEPRYEDIEMANQQHMFDILNDWHFQPHDIPNELTQHFEDGK